jgi:hypothetical protein
MLRRPVTNIPASASPLLLPAQQHSPSGEEETTLARRSRSHHDESSRPSKFHLFQLLFMISIIIVVRYLLVHFTHPRFTCPTKSYPEQIYIHTTGEALGFDCGIADLRILSGAANLLPESSFFNTMLLKYVTLPLISPKYDVSQFRPMKNRTIDLLYRSRNCMWHRERFAWLLRFALESNGFRFVASGYCQGMFYWNSIPEIVSPGEFVDLHEGEDAKIMLAMETNFPPAEYLSEKVFTPLTKGAIPAYYGNGQRYMDLLTLNRARVIDRKDFTSDFQFIEKILDLLRNPEKLQRMQQLPVFHDFGNAQARLDFWNDPLGVGVKGNPELIHYTRTSPKFERIRNKAITFHHTGSSFTGSHEKDLGFFKLAFNATAKKIDEKSLADVEVHTCCG